MTPTAARGGAGLALLREWASADVGRTSRLDRGQLTRDDLRRFRAWVRGLRSTGGLS